MLISLVPYVGNTSLSMYVLEAYFLSGARVQTVLALKNLPYYHVEVWFVRV